jgi:hypothetical protein
MRTSEQIHSSFGYSDAKSKSIVWAAYAEHFAGEEIMEEGFNLNSGYIYIALEHGVTIASAFGQPVEFIIYDDETEEEMFFDSIQEANNFLSRNF